VDNTNLCVTHPSNQASLVAKHMQGSVSNWEGLLWATGGVLVPDNCFWYLLDFEYKNSQWKYMSQQNLPRSLYVHNAVGACTIIPCLEPSEACHMLGVCIAPDGNVEVELHYLQLIA